MNKTKKIIGAVVIAIFLSAMTLNVGLFESASANPLCPGWDGVSAFCGVYGNEQNPCQIVSMCTETCPFGCEP